MKGGHSALCSKNRRRKNNSKTRGEEVDEVGVGRFDGDGFVDGLLHTSMPRKEGFVDDQVDAGDGPEEVVNAEVRIPVVLWGLKEDGPFVSEAEVSKMNCRTCLGL